MGAESEWVLSGCRRGADVVQRREVVQRWCRGSAEVKVLQVKKCRCKDAEVQRCCRGAAEVVPRWCRGNCAAGAECKGPEEVLRFFRVGGAEQVQGAAEELSKCSGSAAKVIVQVQSGDEVQQR